MATKRNPERATRRLLAAPLICLLSAISLTSAQAEIRISEFVADNSGGFLTKAGEAADWIELYNSGPSTVNLGGWYLTDKVSTPAKWRIPDGTTITSNGYLVVFADSAATSTTNGELHANFSLSKDGEYLGLVQPDGVTVADDFEPLFPPQYLSVSYGRAPRERELIGTGTPARYRVPNSEETAVWTNATGALGFSGTNAAFAVRYYEMNAAIANVNTAETMVTNSAFWKSDRTYPITGQYGSIDFHESNASGYFTNNLLFPNHTIGQDKSWFVVVADTSIYVPQAGQWTFCVGSDDGFRLRISGHGVNFASEFAAGRGFGNTLATFSFPVAGVYSLRLIYNENTGGATVEFSVAQGNQSVFSLDAFHLVGDTASGIVHAGAIGALVETDVGGAMRGINARLDAEWSFTLPETPQTNDTLTLAVRFADGFSAAVNDRPVAVTNVPTPLIWNSAATAAQPLTSVMQWASYTVPATAFVVGSNTLAVTALNDTLTNADFLIQPRVVWRTAQRFACFFKTPTPGAANGQAYTAPTPKVSASEPRGYKTAPFFVTLACEDSANAVIRYTLDGGTPWTNSPVYSGPLFITTTTVLRAAVVDPESLKLNIKTASWLFLEDVLQQGATAPSGWPTNAQVNSQAMEYGMRQAIVTSDPARLCNGMTNAISSISLVTDLTNLFSVTSGIYVYPGNDGLAWERPVSVELIDPVHGSNSEFRIDAGLRIRGAASRNPGDPKHSFRLFFRSDYGEDKLKFKLFGDEGADEFDKVDLRTSQNYAWAKENSPQETFIRETFSRDTQRDMGVPYTRSRYYHLFLNGQYWGLYQTQERGDADYAATYLGGNNDGWDCIKTVNEGGYVTSASDGTFDSFYALHNLAINQGFSGTYSNNYWRARGLNPDGTNNTNYPTYLDQDNLINFMIIAFYTGDPDSPVSIWGGFPNNMYGLFNRLTPTGFKWLRHDAEHSLGANSGYGVTCDTTYAGTNFTTQALFNPATLHQRLCEHPDYRMRFADLVQKHLYGNGALTPTNAQARFRSRMSEIDLAIIGESARWGRGKTRDANWLPTCNTVLSTYLTQRRDIIVTHFRNHGWLPRLDVPAFSTNNAAVPSNYRLRVSATNTFYYTTDGSDPRLSGGSICSNAFSVLRPPAWTDESRKLIQRNSAWRYFDTGSAPATTNGLTWKDASFPDSAWPKGPAVLGFTGGTPTNPVSTVIRRYTNGVSGVQVTTAYFRQSFTLESTTGVTNMVLNILRDDGAVVYLNGIEILRENMPSGAMSYTNYASSSTPDQTNYLTRVLAATNAICRGLNIVAVELHQCNATSTDLYFDLSVTANANPVLAATCFADVPVTNAVTVKARTYDGTEWSPLSEASLSVYWPPVDYTPLRVTELMYAPPSPAQGSPYVNDDFAWLELRNTGTTALDLAGVHFASGIVHTFAPLTLPAGARLVLAKNPEAFATLYATNSLTLVVWTSGSLARKGEPLSLVNPAGTNILTFTYSNTWYPATYNAGLSLVAVNLSAAEPAWSTAANWRPSRATRGSPGTPDVPRFTAARTNASRHLLLDAEGLEGVSELWFSDDLQTWIPCNPSAWSMDNGTLTIDTQHPSLPAGDRGFFQLRLRD